VWGIGMWGYKLIQGICAKIWYVECLLLVSLLPS